MTTENLLDVHQDDFATITRQGVTLVDFWAPWCGPCKIQVPILEKLAQQLPPDARIAKINVDENPTVAGQYGIQGIPTLILFRDGEEVNRFVGVQSETHLLHAIRTQLT